MMPFVDIKAYAKVNLTLDVLAQREDGFHEMRMIMQTVGLADHISIEVGTGRGLEMTSDLSFLPTGERNLAAAAALRLAEEAGIDYGGIALTLDKFIPVCAGLGGGSADAAAVLRALNRGLSLGLSTGRLEEIGALVGSDVPYCVRGGTALAEGKGEILTTLPPLPHCYVVLCKPGFSVSTPELFAKLDCGRIRCRPDTAGMIAALESGDLRGVAQRMYNVFEDMLPERRSAEIAALKNAMIQYGALGASMSGTGPTVFGLFDDLEAARFAFEVLRETYRDVSLTDTRQNPLMEYEF